MGYAFFRAVELSAREVFRSQAMFDYRGVLMHHWINWIALREHDKTKKRKPLHLIVKPYGFL